MRIFLEQRAQETITTSFLSFWLFLLIELTVPSYKVDALILGHTSPPSLLLQWVRESDVTTDNRCQRAGANRSLAGVTGKVLRRPVAPGSATQQIQHYPAGKHGHT